MLKYISTAAFIGSVVFICSSFVKENNRFGELASSRPFVAGLQPGKAARNYKNNCAGCHGEKMDAFVDRRWKFGSSRNDLFKAIKQGYPDLGMPSFSETLKNEEIYELADYIISGIKNVDKYSSDNRPSSNVFKTEKLTIRLEPVVKGLDVPWGIAFLPDNSLLVTDRNGKLYWASEGQTPTVVAGVPPVLARGQGGLMDVIVDPEFSKNSIIYLSYSKFKNEGGSVMATTAIMRARLSGNQLKDQKDIFVAQPYLKTQHHYGSRLQFGKDGYLYFSVGERGRENENPQEIKGNDLGKVHRIKADGSIPADNPFVTMAGVQKSIYSYGHRNPQGMTIHPQTGRIWTHEHGPRGGDEINIVAPGKNYGWPVITYGIHYNGKVISNLTEKPGMEQPLHYWIPSIGPSGMAFVKGSRYKGWEGNVMSGSLRFKYLNRSVIENNKVVKEEILFKNIGRVRDVRMAPNGYLYIGVESPGIVYKLVPVAN